MNLQFKSGPSSQEQFFALFLTTGWNVDYHLQPEDLAKALQASWTMIGVYDGQHLVGFGRVVSDTVMHAMIYDLIVLPEYQGQGIGGKILERLIEKCRETGVRDIQLFCARGKRSFYEKRDFVVRPDDAPGMQYVRQGG